MYLRTKKRCLALEPLENENHLVRVIYGKPNQNPRSQPSWGIYQL